MWWHEFKYIHTVRYLRDVENYRQTIKRPATWPRINNIIENNALLIFLRESSVANICLDLDNRPCGTCSTPIQIHLNRKRTPKNSKRNKKITSQKIFEVHCITNHNSYKKHLLTFLMIQFIWQQWGKFLLRTLFI